MATVAHQKYFNNLQHRTWMPVQAPFLSNERMIGESKGYIKGRGSQGGQDGQKWFCRILLLYYSTIRSPESSRATIINFVSLHLHVHLLNSTHPEPLTQAFLHLPIHLCAKNGRMVFFLGLFVESGGRDDNCFNSGMSDSTGKEIMDVLVASEPASRSFFQNFQVQQHIVTHEHRIEVELSEEKGRPFVINNHFATLDQGRLYKVTEITLENRTIKIIDAFTTIPAPLTPLARPDSDSLREAARVQGRRQILNKKYHGNSQGENDARLRDTKNLVKNIVRLFQTWLEERAQAGGQAYRELLEMARSGKFNNNLIISVSQTPPLRAAFLKFCENSAQDFIAKSKIHDKNSHLEALRKYQNLCKEEEELEEQRAEEEREGKSERKERREEDERGEGVAQQDG